MRSSIRLLPFLIILQFIAFNILRAAPVNPVEFTAADTMVNYCKLIRAAYKYGLLAAENKPVLTELEVKEFNDTWKDVFDVQFYQTGITNTEFKTPRFSEGNFLVFPSSKLYNSKNPDTYTLFHVGKEVGKINSQAYQNCPACVKTSIDKINDLIRKTGLLSQFAQLWLNVSSLKSLTSINQIKDFWQFLKCYTIDDRVNPKSDGYFISLPPAIRTPDTTNIQCKDEIVPKVSVGWRHCEIGGKIDTVGPILVRGQDNCPDALYRITFTAKDFCNKSAKANQYFKIDNEGPEIYCPPDTIVDCIENYRHTRPQASSSCMLKAQITSKGPTLILGDHNCPEAIYNVEYTIKDECGRTANCIRKIRILNDGPKITCPPDETVTCFDKIKKGKPEIKISCHKWYKDLRISDPVLVKGKRNCPGAIYEITYTVTDSCDRKASCIQKFTIKNEGPKIKCPQPKEILCEEDIQVGLPESVQVSCDLAYTVTTTDPKLIYGKPNCVGAIYEVWYIITDECGRKDSCQQVFTIFKDALEITCPPDQFVKCYEDIKPSNALVKTACKKHFRISNGAPRLLSGTDDCNAVYSITYTVEDECGRSKTCVQKFAVKSDPPEIKCGPEIILKCYDEIKNYKAPEPKISCQLTHTIYTAPPLLVSGKDRCDGARYKITTTVQDDCGGKAECTQYFRININTAVITCAPDRVVECEEEISAEDITSFVPCQLVYRTEKRGPVLIKGTRNCPGAVYTITYVIKTECEDSVKCVQRFTIANAELVIECPPDKTVHCSKDIKPELRELYSPCGEKVKVELAGPLLISGQPDCPNAKYAYVYKVTDECNRRVTCTQYFTLSGIYFQADCPPDVTVNSKSEIKPYTLKITTGCREKYQVSTTAPILIRGEDGKDGAEYEITYFITGDCDQKQTCRQIFKLKDLTKPDCESFYPNSEAKFNSRTNVWECYCKEGYQWNATRTACVPIPAIPDCNSYYPNSEAKLNPQTNKYECYCITGYQWNATRTACIPIPAIPDCNSYYPNSEAKLNPQTNKYECYCITGYQWNATRTACVPIPVIPDCSSYYANSEAKLNPQTNRYECYCKPGYEWNSTRTACLLAAADCNSYYPNTEAKRNPQTGVIECHCKLGYQWNETRTACVSTQGTDCSAKDAETFSKIVGSWKSYRMHLTIGGSCNNITGTWKVTEWCEGVDETYNASVARVNGTITGKMQNGSIQLRVQAPPSPNNNKGTDVTGSVYLRSDGTLSASFGCPGDLKKQ